MDPQPVTTWHKKSLAQLVSHMDGVLISVVELRDFHLDHLEGGGGVEQGAKVVGRLKHFPLVSLRSDKAAAPNEIRNPWKSHNVTRRM